ncbi:hypothetical protein LRS10_10190 [Phenylobacterium sp. J426]|uniref:hypothetical protein n=1 Tax=Phenylobacterium sp. J426 TaxID=2898439 RepID=UPI0021518132|nr:hypothetical protein [Phenylobacterium sp. J426]MCR5874505.1 hypothetical protein [Phenylobacterium sp. J426]
MGTTLRRPNGRPTGRAVAIAASVAAHVGLFLLFAWRLGERPATVEPPVMVVELTPWPSRAPRERPAPPRRAEVGDRQQREITVRPSRPTPPGVEAPAPAPFAVDDTPGRQALRGLLDCRPANLDRLSPQARERCQQRLAGDPSIRMAAGARLKLDPSGRYAEEDLPYLARKPTKGCKVRAAGGADAMGKQGPVAGVTCAWKF